jgi:hypothetical protein
VLSLLLHWVFLLRRVLLRRRCVERVLRVWVLRFPFVVFALVFGHGRFLDVALVINSTRSYLIWFLSYKERENAGYDYR